MSTRVRVRTSATLAGVFMAGSLLVSAPAHADGGQTSPPAPTQLGEAHPAPATVDTKMMDTSIVDSGTPAYVFAGVGAALMVVGAVLAGLRKRAAAHAAASAAE